VASDCLFCKIIAGEIPSEKIFEDDLIYGFRDISPVAPSHLLLIPKVHLSTLNDLEETHEPIMGRIVRVAREVAAAEGLSGGYRLVANCLSDGGQEVYHIHFHVLGGRKMTWPPG
jgi:histidine triad (HIT) family protein